MVDFEGVEELFWMYLELYTFPCYGWRNVYTLYYARHVWTIIHKKLKLCIMNASKQWNNPLDWLRGAYTSFNNHYFRPH